MRWKLCVLKACFGRVQVQGNTTSRAVMDSYSNWQSGASSCFDVFGTCSAFCFRFAEPVQFCRESLTLIVRTLVIFQNEALGVNSELVSCERPKYVLTWL